MTMPTPLCPHQMQVHSIQQETPDVWTLRLICHDFYPYRPGQYALVSIRNSDHRLRAYTLSSTPGLSPFITLSIRRLNDGDGSRWLTEQVKPGALIWLSNAQGDFTCADTFAPGYVMLAAGCGVTPIMSMTRWLLSQRPQDRLHVVYSVRSPQEIIFANEWAELCQRYPSLSLTVIAERDAGEGALPGRLSRERLQKLVTDIAERRVMICGPEPYMRQAVADVRALGVADNEIVLERFHTQHVVAEGADTLTLISRLPPRRVTVPVGVSLLAAMEQHGLPVVAACRAGVCGCCKTHIASGRYATDSQMTLTQQEIADGYVLACSCRLEGDVELA